MAAGGPTPPTALVRHRPFTVHASQHCLVPERIFLENGAAHFYVVEYVVYVGRQLSCVSGGSLYAFT